MNRTIEDSREFDVVCMSFGKEQEKEIEVVEADKKDSFIVESMEIKVGDCTLDEMKFSRNQVKALMESRAARKTRKAIEKLESQR